MLHGSDYSASLDKIDVGKQIDEKTQDTHNTGREAGSLLPSHLLPILSKSND